MSQSDFEQLASEAGLPTTEAAINAEFEGLRAELGLNVTNTDAFGPFWRFVKAAVTAPVKWLVDFIIVSVLPQAFVKTATGPFLKMHAWAVNIEAKLATKAVGNIQFTRIDTAGDTVIPSGTVVQSETINGKNYSVMVLADTTMADGVATVLILCEALGTGDAYNLGANYYTVLVDDIDGVTVTNLADWLITPGANAEQDDDLRERVRNQYSAINQWHTDAVYTAIIAGFEGVTTRNVYFQHDAPRGPGTANAYVMLETGNPSVEFIAAIQSEITDNGNHGHGDDLQVFAMPETTHNLTTTVWLAQNLTDIEKAALVTVIENIIRCAFRQNTNYVVTKTQPWSLFSFSTLSDDLHRLVPQLVNVTFSLGFITSEMDLPRLGALTVAEYE